MRWVIYCFSLLLLLASVGAGTLAFLLYKYGKGLPDYGQLANYKPPVVTRVHSGDGRLIAEYAKERRVFIPVSVMPKLLIKAFLSSEDKNFFEHSGVDPVSLMNAAINNLLNFYKNKRPRGASTITQQVAKNFLLSNELSLERKIKEAILAFRIEKAFSKNRILELYLNEIYLGMGSYGVAAAALNYFDKSLDELTVEEAAYLAALPKAPNNYHPVRKRGAAIARRNWVIQKMHENGFISETTMKLAQSIELKTKPRSETEFVDAKYFVEDVRRKLISKFGSTRLYGGGLSVRTSVDPALQKIADQALQRGLIKYDRRHGWRKPIATIDVGPDWDKRLSEIEKPKGVLPGWKVAVVLDVGIDSAKLGLRSGEIGFLENINIGWKHEWRKNQKIGRRLKQLSDFMDRGSVVLVEMVDKHKSLYKLRQIPQVNGALIALDPHTGRVLAMTGGWSFESSEFNRATQAFRQPGSAFKPFVYLAALDRGYSPATRILDAPFVIDQGPGLGKWKPANYTRKFYGPSAMRIGIEKSRNLMTVRLARTIGMKAVAKYAHKFDIMANMPEQLSMSLGAGETTLMKLTAAYAMLVNGGKRIKPTFIDRIQDRNGKTIFRQDERTCSACNAKFQSRSLVPQVPDLRAQVVSSTSAYQMVRMLEGVVTRGTGRRIAEIKKPLAGKTGTTNSNFDTWFIGFTPDLAVGVYVGFDKPRTLGPRDTGSNVAAPIFKSFMEQALSGVPVTPFRAPPGILHVRIDPSTGNLATKRSSKTITEVFKAGNEPDGISRVLDGGYAGDWKPGDSLPLKLNSTPSRGGQGIY